MIIGNQVSQYHALAAEGKALVSERDGILTEYNAFSEKPMTRTEYTFITTPLGTIASEQEKANVTDADVSYWQKKAARFQELNDLIQNKATQWLSKTTAYSEGSPVVTVIDPLLGVDLDPQATAMAAANKQPPINYMALLAMAGLIIFWNYRRKFL